MSRPLRQREAAARRYTLRGEFEYGGLPNVHLAFLEGAGGFRRTVVVQRLSPTTSTRRGEPLLSPDALLGCHTRHPNVIPVLDLIEERGEHLLVLEYVISTTLTRLLRDGNRPPLPITSAILSGVLHALDAAHEARDDLDVPLEIVHAGVSPDNVLLGVDGTARLIHFGQDRRGPARGQTELAKPGYVSPEQVFDQRADRRSDVFASAILLWECLCGRPLLEGDSVVDAMLRFLARPAFAASAINPCVPKKLDAVLARALEPTPERRFPSARAFAEELEALIAPASREDVARYVEGVAWSSLHEQELLLRGTPEEEPTPRLLSPQLSDAHAPRAGTEPESPAIREDPALARGFLVNSGIKLKEEWRTAAANELTKVDGVRPLAPPLDIDAATDRDLEIPGPLPKAPATVEYPSGLRRERVPIYLWVALVVAALGLAASVARTEFGRTLRTELQAMWQAAPNPKPSHVETRPPLANPATTPSVAALATAPQPPPTAPARILSIEDLPVAKATPPEGPPPKLVRKGRRQRAR